MNLYIYACIYILSSTDRSVSFYQNSSVWLDSLDSRSWDRNPVDSNANPRFYYSATRKLAQAMEFKRLCITFVLVYIYPLNSYRELDSYEEHCITLVANLLLPSLGELNPTGVGEHIYGMHLERHPLFLSLSLYIYIWCLSKCIPRRSQTTSVDWDVA